MLFQSVSPGQVDFVLLRLASPDQEAVQSLEIGKEVLPVPKPVIGGTYTAERDSFERLRVNGRHADAHKSAQCCQI